MTLVASLVLSLALQDQDRIQDLIRKLGSDDFATREQATEDLKKAGKTAREALQKASSESDDPEVRQRARNILDELARAEKPKPRRAEVEPVPGFSGSSVTVKTVNGNSSFTIKPNGEPPITFHKAASGQVKLDYTDEKNESKSVESVTLEEFLKDYSELAQKYGISSEGIDYAGSRVSFNGRALPRFNMPRFQIPQRPNRLTPPLPLEDEDDATPVAGALLRPVDDSLRAQLDIPDGQGAVVTKVTPGSLAAALGLKKSDVLLEIDGRKVTSPDAAKGLITKDSAAVVLRKGKKETLGGVKKDF